MQTNPSICFYFQVHQPDRLRQYRFFDIGNDHYYFDEFLNRTILRRVADTCYLPMNALIKDLIVSTKGQFKVAFSISGSAIDQFEKYAPEVLESFRDLASTGCVEFLGETYSHSLASLTNPDQFTAQVKMHSDLIKKHFGKKPASFRNTELVYSDQIGKMVSKLGFSCMLTEGARGILGWKSPNYLYTCAAAPKLKLLLRNFKLSDDMAFRFSNQSWNEWPLTADKYVAWLQEAAGDAQVINLFMDYETFGEHQKASGGILEFFKAVVKLVLAKGSIDFITPAQAAKKFDGVAELNVPYPISWADEERDTTAWLGNELQNEAFSKLYALSDKVVAAEDAAITKDFLRLQESDHFYYMCTKFFSDGAVHSYFNPYASPYDAFINYMNVLSDFALRVNNKLKQD